LTADASELRPGTTETLVKGKPVAVDTLTLNGLELVVSGTYVRTARVADDWYTDLDSPEGIIDALRKRSPKVDIFTFWQRLPETAAKYAYYYETESIAALPISTYDNWWSEQLNTKTRNLVRKAQKTGIVVKPATFDDHFVHGMTSIFNESPIRQGKRFWHYGKDAATVKREFSRFLFREDIFGAYYKDELIGFIFLAYAGRYALLGQIISKLEHRDKAPNNALVAKAVEVCYEKSIPYLVYASWVDGTLGDFKRHNGFQRVDLPRYYVPLTFKGSIALRFGLHHGLVGAVPDSMREAFVSLRKNWYARRRGAQPTRQ